MASFFFSGDDTQAAKLPQGQRPVLMAVPASAPLATDISEPTPSGLGQRRAEVSPPTLFFRSRPAWKVAAARFWSWLWEIDHAQPQSAPMMGLRKVKSEFCSALWDLQSLRAQQVRDMIERARSLRELWHLRADVFRVIAVHRGQAEAQLRLDSLDNHFPVRSSTRSEQVRDSKVASW